MLEFVFFDPRPRDQFLVRLRQMGIESECRSKGGELLVLLSDETEAATMERIEKYYEETMRLSERLMAEEEGAEHVERAAIEVQLQEGPLLISVDAELLRKLLSAVSFEELGRFADSIARAVEEPDRRPLCKR